MKEQNSDHPLLIPEGEPFFMVFKTNLKNSASTLHNIILRDQLTRCPTDHGVVEQQTSRRFGAEQEIVFKKFQTVFECIKSVNLIYSEKPTSVFRHPLPPNANLITARKNCQFKDSFLVGISTTISGSSCVAVLDKTDTSTDLVKLGFGAQYKFWHIFEVKNLFEFLFDLFKQHHQNFTEFYNKDMQVINPNENTAMENRGPNA